jgi:hypothetical protein
MRQPFVHEAVLAMADTADERAPGAAITVELCGHWEHEPPCPLASHHTAARRCGDEVHLRVLFAADADQEAEVRSRIDSALANGYLSGPNGNITVWELRNSGPAAVNRAEVEHAARLVAG